MMISVNLKDSVLTIQSSTNYVDLKSKIIDKEYFCEKRMCIVLQSTAVQKSNLYFKEKAFPAWCCTKQTKL